MRRGMTLIPRLFSHWWETLEQSHRLMDQQFGRGLRPEQFFPSAFYNKSPFKMSPYSFYRPWIDWEREAENGWSIIKDDKNQFRVILDVQQFKPEEVNVKVVDNFIVVEGKHEEKEDDHGIISRHFVRKYLVPDQCDPEKATSSLSTDGVLTITAPLKPEAIQDRREKTIKIERTEKSSEEPEKLAQSQ
ncbi:Protein lethal(2)essential for life [Anthophora plagiata]